MSRRHDWGTRPVHLYFGDAGSRDGRRGGAATSCLALAPGRSARPGARRPRAPAQLPPKPLPISCVEPLPVPRWAGPGGRAAVARRGRRAVALARVRPARRALARTAAARSGTQRTHRATRAARRGAAGAGAWALDRDAAAAGRGALGAGPGAGPRACAARIR
jgi:hypothetical protein